MLWGAGPFATWGVPPTPLLSVLSLFPVGETGQIHSNPSGMYLPEIHLRLNGIDVAKTTGKQTYSQFLAEEQCNAYCKYNVFDVS